MEISNCTRCGKEINNLRINVVLKIDAQRLKDSSTWEDIPNLNNISREVLCEDCFDKFATIMSQMNIKYEG
jgi:hypothetical protein